MKAQKREMMKKSFETENLGLIEEDVSISSNDSKITHFNRNFGWERFP